MTLSYVDAGTGTPVLLLHGIPGAAAAWAPVIDRLADRHRLLAPDLLGFGRSPDAVDLHAEAQAGAVADLLDGLGVGAVHVAAHDFGGPVALRLLERRPDLVRGLLLAATNAHGDTPVPFPLSTIFLPVVGGLAAAALFSPPSLRLLLRTGTGRPAVRLDPAVYVGDSRQAASIRSVFERSLRELERLYGPLAALLPRIDVPVRIVWGDRDPFFGVAQGRRLADAVPGATFTLLAGAGHFLPGERPADLAAEIEALVRTPVTDGR